MATLFRRPDPQPGQRTYTIDIPGAADLFHFIIPSLNDPELKRQRIQRMLTHESLVPEKLQWIPAVINQIDDAQDLLTTALWLSKPLLKRLPSRFIPFVGWALTVSDIANLSTTILGLAMTPGLQKPDIHKAAKGSRWKKKYARESYANWIRPGGWRRKIGDLLQAAQAADTITGVGLTLGSVMGFASDIMWAPYRALKGDRVEIRLPPEGDPLTKAYRLMMGAPQQWYARDILSPEDHAILIAAQTIATDIIQTQGTPPPDDRVNEALNYQIPTFIPWEQSSLQALNEYGFDLSRQNYYTPYTPHTPPTYQSTITDAPSNIILYQEALRREIGEDIEGNIFWLAYREAALNLLEQNLGWTEDDIVDYTIEERAALQVSELNFRITSYPPDVDAYKFLQTTKCFAPNIATGTLTREHLIATAQRLGCSWQPKY